MLENCKRLICSSSLNKVYCIVLYCIVLYCIVLYCKRRIREAIEIHCQTPTLNRDNGYELPPIYGNVLSRGFHHHVTKHPTPPLDTDSVTESKACDLVKFWIL